MAKVARAICDRCEHRVVAGDPFCGTCGYPSSWANHEERTAWEVAQYRHKSANAPIGVPYDRPKPTIVLDKPKAGRRIGIFSRRSHTPQLLQPEPKRVDPTMSVQAPPEPAPDVETAPILMAVPIRTPKTEAPIGKPIARLKSKKIEDEPARDTPATVLAMRLLNTRVAELDAMVRELRREIEALRDMPRERFGR